MQVIKMNQVVMLKLSAHQQVTNHSGVFGNGHAKCHIYCPHRGQSMSVSSDPAGTLHKMVGVPRITTLEYHFNTSEHLSRTPGIDDFAAFYLHLNLEVAFYSGDWINYNTFAH
jgi:hypothetical protein